MTSWLVFSISNPVAGKIVGRKITVSGVAQREEHGFPLIKRDWVQVAFGDGTLKKGAADEFPALDEDA
jgi:hypothetical protein